MYNIKYCKKCKKAFDIGINYDICPRCRREKKLKINKKYGEKLTK